MQKNLNKTVLDSITYLIGNADTLIEMQGLRVRKPFDEEIVRFLNDVSRLLMKMQAALEYPDVITFGFWIRKASIMKLKERNLNDDGNMHLGRGVAFHIAPSNVPVNYAYSLVAGLLTGNANVVRIPSKGFPQVDIINRAIIGALERYESIRPYICLVRYDRNQEINNLLSSIADTRIIWGGDKTITEVRKSQLAPRANEITFADRYSLAVIDSNIYVDFQNKRKIAEDFYNDTYLTDQNACTSPRMVIWMGEKIEEAKEEFWNELYDVVREKYVFQPIQGINKLVSSYLTAIRQEGTIIENHPDNLIMRVNIPQITNDVMELKDNSGYFLEYDCNDIMEIRELCNDKHCQTIGYIGNKNIFSSLLHSGIKGIDRVVPIGKTMDFDLIWDGYNLVEQLTRRIQLI